MHFGYCTNIHPGEAWDDHFRHLREQVPAVKAAHSPNAPLGLGLRVANQASLDLGQPESVAALQRWLTEAGCYIFTMNGFPYGGFHDQRVKDHVHAPDWTTTARVDYTIRLFRLLAQLLPDDLTEGGVSTSPLSYQHWWETPAAAYKAMLKGTQNVLLVLDELMRLRQETGKVLHLDIEPEPDGLLDNLDDFLDWYTNTLRPAARTYLAERHGLSAAEADAAVHDHIQLCYDICHMAVTYETTDQAIQKLTKAGIRVGKIQISSALHIDFSMDAAAKLDAIRAFDEPTYLHQVVARLADGTRQRFADLPDALAAYDPDMHREWRIHFHVPLFLETYGLLGSTQQDVVTTLHWQRTKPFTEQLEVETYTWGVLPADAQLPISESIARELAWVKTSLDG
ncbi:metabolite traffic protein EboE [Fibrella sp. WM1]|uniref:metabolite traffic protein EboE n=1 Tax=Fibrella musci TaxID=3242485 RepID=UPI003522FEAC